jgi:hypothetical protein
MENTAVLETPSTSEPVVEEKNEILEAAVKRAHEEVVALEMTQQVLAMVERSMQKPGAESYNHAGVKKYLHELQELPPDTSAEEVNGMEFIFWQEIQLWRSALAHRDSCSSATDLRYYCESCKPPLSEQALFSLARFYRSLPASERTTFKFDMIVTRLFSVDEEDGSRRLAMMKTAIGETLEESYKEWLGISPQNTIDEAKIDQAIAGFSNFTSNSQEAKDLDALIADSFFGQIREYKRSLNQIFYAPRVAAAAIDCNVRIGNRFIELLDEYREKQKAEKRGSSSLDPLLEQAVSEATNKTLQVVYEAQRNHEKLEKQRELDRLLNRETLALPEQKIIVAPKTTATSAFLGINKWLLVGGFCAVLCSSGFYLWTEYGGVEAQNVHAAQKIDEKGVPGGEYLNTARVNANILYGVVSDKWNSLSDDAKKKALEQIAGAGKDKGYSQVSLLNTDGKVVAQVNEQGPKVF